MDESSILSLLGTSFVHEDIVTPQWLSTWINLKFNIESSMEYSNWFRETINNVINVPDVCHELAE